MPNAAVFSVSVSLQVQVIDLATALVEINRLYNPQVNCAMLTPQELYAFSGVNITINPTGQVNLLAFYNKSTTANFGLTLNYGTNGVAPVAGQQINVAPGSIFLFFDPSALNWLNNITCGLTVVGGGPAAFSVIAASVNG